MYSMYSIKPFWIKDNIWQEDERIKKAREIIAPKIAKALDDTNIFFDGQDLEHQVLFRMTTYPEEEAFKKIDEIFDEQLYITKERMVEADTSPSDLFRLGHRRTDEKEWKLKWANGREHLIAEEIGGSKKRRVVWRQVEGDEKDRLDAIVNDYHYIHCSRGKGWTIGFYFEDEDLPFAIEQIEPCSVSRDYKRAMMELLGVDVKKGVEITRFYTIPNTPKMVIGIRDKVAEKVLKQEGKRWMFTSVMPVFAKTKATTIAGGMDIPIFAKELKIKFYRRPDGRYKFCVNRKREMLGNPPVIENEWSLFPVIEMMRPFHPMIRAKFKNPNRIYYVQKE